MSKLWGRPIREILEDRPDVTDDVLAKRAGVSPRVVSKARKGHRLNFDTADRLCLALGYTLGELYGAGDGDPLPEERADWAATRARDEANRRGPVGHTRAA